MKNIIGVIFLWSLAGSSSPVSAQVRDSVYMFSYFVNNGRDGLHLAYSEDGFQWEVLNDGKSVLLPTAGRDKLMRDPCIIRGGDHRFHMVWTVSWNEQGIGYASSRDLIHWSKQRYIPLMEGSGALNCWAPEINYDTRHKRYMIYWASTIPGRFPDTDSSGDGSYNHRMYYTFTKKFRKFTEPELLYDKGFTVIDATIKRYRNKYYMFLKDETKVPVPQKNIKIAESDRLEGPYSDPSGPVTGNYWAEGPTVLKKDNEWILYFDKYRDHKYGAVASDNLRNWSDISDQIEMPGNARHGTVFTISKTEFRQFFKKEINNKRTPPKTNSIIH